jgi:hypothetical protein
LNQERKTTFKEDGSHRTTPYKPFRFWLNNDYDVVSNNGTIEEKITTCPGRTDAGQATCGQGDEAPAWAESHPPQYANNPPDYSTHSNIYDSGGPASNFKAIECERDLEDFAPLALKLAGLKKDDNGKFLLPDGWNLKMRAKNVGVNLFKGKWTEGIEYLTDPKIAGDQVNPENKLYVFAVNDTQGQDLLAIADDAESNKLFDSKTDIAKFIFEGITASPSYEPKNDGQQEEEPPETYLEVYLAYGDKEISLAKV